MVTVNKLTRTAILSALGFINVAAIVVDIGGGYVMDDFNRKTVL